MTSPEAIHEVSYRSLDCTIHITLERWCNATNTWRSLSSKYSHGNTCCLFFLKAVAPVMCKLHQKSKSERNSNIRLGKLSAWTCRDTGRIFGPVQCLTGIRPSIPSGHFDCGWSCPNGITKNWGACWAAAHWSKAQRSMKCFNQQMVLVRFFFDHYTCSNWADLNSPKLGPSRVFGILWWKPMEIMNASYHMFTSSHVATH